MKWGLEKLRGGAEVVQFSAFATELAGLLELLVAVGATTGAAPGSGSSPGRGVHWQNGPWSTTSLLPRLHSCSLAETVMVSDSRPVGSIS